MKDKPAWDRGQGTGRRVESTSSHGYFLVFGVNFTVLAFVATHLFWAL
jgi:hypothetical protein